jgi:hypothetical protein
MHFPLALLHVMAMRLHAPSDLVACCAFRSRVFVSAQAFGFPSYFARIPQLIFFDTILTPFSDRSHSFRIGQSTAPALQLTPRFGQPIIRRHTCDTKD